MTSVKEIFRLIQAYKISIRMGKESRGQKHWIMNLKLPSLPFIQNFLSSLLSFSSYAFFLDIILNSTFSSYAFFLDIILNSTFSL